MTIFHDVWNAQLEKPRHFYQRCTNVWIRKVILIFHGSIFMFSHMRTMVLEYAHLHHWVIVWVNDGKYTSTMVRIWVYENSLYSCFFSSFFPPFHWNQVLGSSGSIVKMGHFGTAAPETQRGVVKSARTPSSGTRRNTYSFQSHTIDATCDAT